MAGAFAPPEKRPFVTGPLKTDSPDSDRIFLTDLLSFFRHPCRFFVRDVLDIRLEEEEKIIPDTELFSLAGLDRYTAEQLLLELKLEKIPDQDIYEIMSAAGKLPLGAVGRKYYDSLRREGELFVKHLEDHAPARAAEIVAIDLPLGGGRLAGSLRLWSPHGLFLYRYADLKGKDLLPAWIQHLVLEASFPERTWENHLSGRNSWYQWSPAGESTALLAELAELFQAGKTRPLKIFPQTSFAFALALQKGKPQEKALQKARQIWERERENDPALKLCFPQNASPLDDDFMALAAEVFTPLLWSLRSLASDGITEENDDESEP
jgi:exodeoxyribonuclease V gamma subunit